MDFADQLNVRPALFAARADALMKQRNAIIHPKVLYDDVRMAHRLLDSHPDLREQFKHETAILQNFELLQNCFANRA